MGKEKKDKYPYEKYVKYEKGLDKNALVYTKEEWENFDEIKRKVEYNHYKDLYYWMPCFYVGFGLLVVGGMVGCIIYHIHIDDILNGILLALGFPIFIIAGFFGAGKV